IPSIVAVNEPAVYPNPAASSLTVTGAEKEEVVQFIDVAGKELLSLKLSANSNTNVDVSHFPNIFFMKRQNGEVRKIVKE
ncbi:MAG: T9SS type A sorting domain-containing protein, partial [Bacteroidia bacterium]